MNGDFFGAAFAKLFIALVVVGAAVGIGLCELTGWIIRHVRLVIQ